jgi:hypothetical protein
MSIFVIPAQAGIQSPTLWTPASAGVTTKDGPRATARRSHFRASGNPLAHPVDPRFRGGDDKGRAQGHRLPQSFPRKRESTRPRVRGGDNETQCGPSLTRG